MPEESDNRFASTAVLLGASNLSLAWPRVVPQLERRLSAPRKVLTAHGMGRSYSAKRCRFVFRQLPGILESGIWNALTETSTAVPTFALLTDFGNDLVFGSPPDDVAAAARECIDRLRASNAATHIVMTRPPLSTVQALSGFRFSFFRNVLFPKCRMSLAEIRTAVEELDRLIVELATDTEVSLIEPAAHWYGLDPIHVLRQYQTDAFSLMMDAWNLPSPVRESQPVRWVRPAAETRWRFGREHRTPQPVQSTPDTAIYAY